MNAYLNGSSLNQSYRPGTLSEIVGQPAVTVLASFLDRPYTSCWLLEGDAGTGKTSTAMVIAKLAEIDTAKAGAIGEAG